MTQYARPSSDSTVGTWLLTPLWSNLDEVVADDAATEISAAGSASCVVNLAAVTDPQSSDGHTIRIRLRDNNTVGNTFSVSLYQGGAFKAGFLAGDGAGAYYTATYTLTAAEADSITDYSSLQISIDFSDVIGGANAFVTWAVLEVPDFVISPLLVPTFNIPMYDELS